jgi:hypothetical protein
VPQYSAADALANLPASSPTYAADRAGRFIIDLYNVRTTVINR